MMKGLYNLQTHSRRHGYRTLEIRKPAYLINSVSELAWMRAYSPTVTPFGYRLFIPLLTYNPNRFPIARNVSQFVIHLNRFQLCCCIPRCLSLTLKKSLEVK